MALPHCYRRLLLLFEECFPYVVNLEPSIALEIPQQSEVIIRDSVFD